MTESESRLEALAQAINRARQAAGCAAAEIAPEAAAEDIPHLGSEASCGSCLVSVLASGSKGNAVFVQCGHTRILIDAGISCRRVEQGLKTYGCSLADIDAVFLTHEHADHVSGLPVLLKKSHMPVYTTEETWRAVGSKAAAYHDRFVRLTRRVGLGDIQVVPFAIPHDAARPVGYAVYHRGCKITLATDLGCITPEVETAAQYSDILILEANHDEQMVRTGPYPYHLQQRILSTYGHLSNTAAAEFLAHLPSRTMMRVLLAHRSETNNTPAVSLHTVRRVLAGAGKVMGQDMILRLACQRGQVRYQNGGTIL